MFSRAVMVNVLAEGESVKLSLSTVGNNGEETEFQSSRSQKCCKVESTG